MTCLQVGTSDKLTRELHEEALSDSHIFEIKNNYMKLYQMMSIPIHITENTLRK